MFDHEMRVADAAHQYPAQKPVNAVAGMSQLMGHRDALHSGHKAHRQGNAQCKLPARGRAIQAALSCKASCKGTYRRISATK